MARKNTLVTFTMLSTIMFFNQPTYAFLGTIGANLIMGSAGSSGSAPAPKTSSFPTSVVKTTYTDLGTRAIA